MLMLPLSVCRYDCWERMVAKNFPAVDNCTSPFDINIMTLIMIYTHTYTHTHFRRQNKCRQHVAIQRPINVNANDHCGKPFTESLLVKPVANSNMISCQSGLILYSNLMSPDKHFTSQLKHQRECATVSMTTQQIHI